MVCYSSEIYSGKLIFNDLVSNCLCTLERTLASYKQVSAALGCDWVLLPVGGEVLLPDLDSDVTCLPSLVQSQQVCSERRRRLQDHCICRRERGREKREKDKRRVEGKRKVGGDRSRNQQVPTEGQRNCTVAHTMNIKQICPLQNRCNNKETKFSYAMQSSVLIE